MTTPQPAQLTIFDHRRDPLCRYIYPVVSRRAGGVSLGINLNPNAACNWACCYCQVEGLSRGSAPPIDIALLTTELDAFLAEILSGEFMSQRVPPTLRELKDVAFSGDGEPTSARPLTPIVAAVVTVLTRWRSKQRLPLRLITNGSQVNRLDVQAALRLFAENDGEIWFKCDRVDSAAMAKVNNVRYRIDAHLRRLRLTASLAPTWLQSCWFDHPAFDRSETQRQQRDFIEAIVATQADLKGVLLYSLARPSMQPGGQLLGAWSQQRLDEFARDIERHTGLKVVATA